jgi:L-malate glycosyltransferase
MNICYMITSLGGGASVHLQSLIRVIDKKSNHITLICDRKQYSQYGEKRFGQTNEIDIQLFDLSGFFNIRAIYQLRKYFNSQSFEIIHSHTGKADILTYLSFGRKTKPILITTIHGIIEKELKLKKALLKYIFYISLLSIIYKKFDGIICVSNAAQKSKVLKYVNKKSTRITIINNGYHYKNQPHKTIAIPQKNYYEFAFIGRISPEKGFEILLEALLKLKNDSVLFKLRIYGEFYDLSYKQKIYSIINKNSFQKYLEFNGYVDNINGKLNKIDFIIIPSLSETFSLAIFDGWANEIPIIASEIDGIKEIIRNNENGILFKCGDSNDLYKKIKYMVNNKKLFLKIRKNGLRRLVNNYSDVKTAKMTMNYYNKIRKMPC